MKKKLAALALFLCIITTHAFATINLIQAYERAVLCDPTFKAAEALYLANRENYPIARSFLLPNIFAQASVFRQRIANDSSGSPFSDIDPFYNTQTIYNLTLVQPIFNYGYWANFVGAAYFVKQSEATFCDAQQDLMLRVAQAYFAVLEASDNLRYTQAEKRAVAIQLEQSRQQFEVGLIAITAYDEARARYDSILAAEIAAQKDLANALEQLSTITGVRYAAIMGPQREVPLVRPQPDNILEWLNCAVKQNYQLHAAEFAADVARENIREQFAGHLPIINFQADYTQTKNTNPLTFTAGGFSQSSVAEAGVTAALPVYQGGLINAQTRQASFQYEQAVSQMELTYRTLLANTRDAYLGVVAGISQIRADRATVLSNRSSLQATLNAYAVGTRTMADVLTAQSTLYESQKVYTSDQYLYLVNTLTLKKAAGTLSPNDLAKINCWLTRKVDIAGKIASIYQAPRAPVILSTKQSSKKAAGKIMPLRAVTPIRTNHKLKPLTPAELKAAARLPATDEKMLNAKIEKALKIPVEKRQPNEQPEKLLAFDEIWLVVHKRDYAIELFDTKVEQHAKRFIRDNQLQGKAIYYRAKTSAGPRYRVIYGVYTSTREAEMAIRELPPNLKNLNPWVRNFEKIQEEMK